MSIVLQGSTSGSVTLQEPAVAGTTVLTLPAVTGNVLTDTSPKAGNVIQVVNATYATQVTSTSATFSDIGLTATITPTSSSSKILIIVTITSSLFRAGTDAGGNYRIVRDSTAVYGQNLYGLYVQAGLGSVGMNHYSTISYLDSPATTSSTVYKVQQNAFSGAIYSQNNNDTSVITLMEIAA
jgi:hypothetical protein